MVTGGTRTRRESRPAPRGGKRAHPPFYHDAGPEAAARSPAAPRYHLGGMGKGKRMESKGSQQSPTGATDATGVRKARKVPGHARFSADVAKIVAGFRLLGLEREEDRSRLRRLAGPPAEISPKPAGQGQELNNTTRSD